MDVLVRGKQINLSDQDFLSEGGEGRIYVKDDLAYKIYTGQKGKIQNSKIKELSVLDKSYICKPLDVVKDFNRKEIGFTMEYVQDGIPLCKFFTSDFWQKKSITVDHILKIIEQLQEGIEYIHSKDILLVDINELNFLVRMRIFPYFIDVDSYQTPNNPATAIMPHIRDWQAKEFSKLTDWYSFAIIVCQLLVGIHPFKGNHPKYTRKDIQKRMLNNVSIFNKEVRVPAATRDFSYIPKIYRDWFVDVFEKGNRSLPPVGVVDRWSLNIVESSVTEVVGGFKVEFLGEYYGGIHKPTHCAGISIDEYEKRYKGKFFILNGIPFVLGNNNIMELFADYVGKNLIISPRNSWKVMPYATQVMDGVICQNILGRKHLSFLYKNERGKVAYSIIHIPELDQYKIIEGKQEKGVCIIIGYKEGKYDEFILKFNGNCSKYSIQKQEDIDFVGINFTVLDNGLVVTFEDGYVRIFFDNIGSNEVKIIKNDSINPKMRICSDENQVRYTEGNRLYSIKMR